MIWSSMFPSNPYTIRNDNARGPAYGHSLFEDGAEYGYGITKGGKTRRTAFTKEIQAVVDGQVPAS